MRRVISAAVYWSILVFGVGLPVVQGAGSPSAEQALKLAPIQEGVDYDRPTPEQAAKCKIEARKIDGRVGWIVEDAAGTILRKFVDTNGDNVVDQWSYYKDGLEVYRDIDSDFNGKADQYRWFHTAGSRWGVDENEDGRVDSWKAISAEEVTAEIVAALATRDADRFAKVVLTPNELKSLGLGKSRETAVAEKLARVTEQFNQLAARQKSLAADAAWLQFTGNKPGVVPLGTDGSTKDFRVYENVMAMAQTGGKQVQVQIGTLVQVGDVWRVIDVPSVLGEGSSEVASQGFFFQTPLHHGDGAAGTGPSEQMQKLLDDLATLDKQAGGGPTKFSPRRAELLEEIAVQARTPEERTSWLRQLADTISAGVQSGTCDDGAERLAALFDKLQKAEGGKNLAAYVKFRQLTAEYGKSLQGPKSDFTKIQTQWVKNLEQYIADYPTSPDAAEAMLQLAITQEFAGQDDEAMKWHNRILAEFPQSPAAQKAAGARVRLDSVGKSILFTGRTTTGQTLDLARYRGKVVLIQYWATWCEPCKADMATLRTLAGKYPNQFAVIGVSLDTNPKDLADFLAEARLSWPQIFEEGGLDSRPANQLGILTLPTMILVDQQGKVVERNIQSGDIEAQLKKLIR